MFDQKKTRSQGQEGHCSYLVGGRSRGSNDVSYEFTKLSQAVETNIHKISENVLQMNRVIDEVSQSSDNPEQRDRLHKLQHFTNQLAKDTSSLLKVLADLPPSISKSDQRHCKLHRERLMNEFASALNSFQLAQRRQKDMEHESIFKARSHLADPFVDDGEEGQLVVLDSPLDQKVLLEEEGDVELLKEYEQAINQLESDIMDVNEIFKDLGRMVHEQSELIDSIEANIEASAVDVAYATGHLQQAHRHQSRSRRRLCMMVFVLLVVAAFLILIIYLAIKH